MWLIDFPTLVLIIVGGLDLAYGRYDGELPDSQTQIFLTVVSSDDSHRILDATDPPYKWPGKVRFS